nr:activating signal cointegrator 1 complex subunit 3 [Ciona intestinalis]|eukprot:XP_018669768.1 activating signal cointegrator 1 complex subunit 3 [Ciona intestinalis]
MSDFPSFTATLRSFGSISKQTGQLNLNKRSVHGECDVWKELQAIVQVKCKEKRKLNELKASLRELLELASDIVGGEEDIKSKHLAATQVFFILYKLDEVDTKTLQEVRHTIGRVDLKSLNKHHQVVKTILDLTHDGVREQIEKLENDQSSNEFGRKIKFSSDLPVMEISYDFDRKDRTNGVDIAETFRQKHKDLTRPNSVAQLKTENRVSANTGLPWLRRQMELKFQSTQLVEPTLAVLKSSQTNEQIQNELCELLGFEHLDLISELLQRRESLVQDEKHLAAINQHRGNFHVRETQQQQPTYGAQITVQTDAEKQVAKAIRREEKKAKKLLKSMIQQNDEDDSDFLPRNKPLLLTSEPTFSLRNNLRLPAAEKFPGVYDGQTVTQQSAAFVGGVRMALPEGVDVKNTKRFEEVSIPATIGYAGQPWPLVKITELDEIGQMAFNGIKKLNTIQSRVFETAYRTNENLLICAPTGAGKTNVAMLSIVKEIIQNVESGVIQLDKFKIVYVAPMKALAAEMAENFGRRLSPLGVSVRELTGDMQLTKKEIQSTQMLITTPEKWDVVTRKSTSDVALARLVRLLIIDEVHLLHDERGPVLETLVARTLRQVETQQTMIRIVGLSATLPNYIDVARFLRVNPYETVAKNLQNNNQVLVFVHARNATVRTAQAILELARENNETSLFDCRQMDGFSQAEKQVQRSRNKEVRELFNWGLGVHHAGMLRADRTMLEKLFAKGLIRVLCCTATLAWGVNLPAHAVVIKGTQVYNAKQGSFVDLGILDVMQIFGRAGRPQFDTTGEGTIITTHNKLSHYLALLTRQHPIESQFVDCLVDNLNAEISLGTVNTVDDGVRWLSYTYLFVRLRKNPLVYGISALQLENDPTLFKWQHELIVMAAMKLNKAHMIRYVQRTGYFHPTDLGRTSSHFYIKYRSIETFNELINSTMDISAIFSMISKSHEFEQIKVRDDELTELDDLKDDFCHLPIKAGPEDTEGKANILFQTFISRGDVRSFSLSSDLMYIAQNAGRIVRGVFEIVLKQDRARLAGLLLKLCKSVERRLWAEDSPLRQFGPRLTNDVLRKIEDKNLTIEKILDSSASEIGHLLHHPRIGEKVRKCAQEIPRVELEVTIQPITRTILRIKVVMKPDFTWNNNSHGNTSEAFWIWVQDPVSDHMYHSDYVLMPKKTVVRGEAINLTFTIPLTEPHPTQYLVKVESDRWFGAGTVCPITFKHLILPDRHPPHTELTDLEPLPITALKDEKFESVYNFSHFNPIQTQIFHCIYHHDTNVLIGAPTGSGKTVAAELAIFRMLRTQPGAKAVYVAPLKALVRERMKDWEKRLKHKLGLKLVELTGDIAPDMRAVARADVIITTPEKWDGVSRSWNTRGYVRKVSLLIIDEIHLLGQDRGPVLEVIVSRTNFISSHTEKAVRVVGLSTALANARDLADWLGIKQMGLFNFRPSVRPVPMEVHIQGFSGKHYCPRMASMNKTCFQAIQTHSPTKPVLIFVSSRRQTRLTALDLIAHLGGENDPKQWMHMDEWEMEELTHMVRDPNLRLTLAFGIGLHHAGLMERDRSLVEKLFSEQKIQSLIATSTLAWGVNLPAHLVIVKGTEYFDGKQGRYEDFPITDVLQMMGRAGRPQYDDKAVAVILVHDVKKAFYKKFLYEPFPVESSLLQVIDDHLNAEIVAGTISNKQEAMDYLTWTYFFRRLLMNPSYYGLDDTDHDCVNYYLSKLLERNIVELRMSGCVAMGNDDDDVMLESTNGGRIASFYYLSHLTLRLLNEDMRPEMPLDDLLKLLSDAQEYHELPVRHNEDSINSDLAKELPIKVDCNTFDSAHTKTLLLLVAHFQRSSLPSTDYATDLKSVLDQAIRVLQAYVDYSADVGWLSTSLRCMHIIQMVSQASWFHENNLMTLPHVERNKLFIFNNLKFKKGKVENLPQLLSVYQQSPNAVNKILKQYFSADEVNKICNHLSALPLVGLELSVRGWWADHPQSEDQRIVVDAYDRSIRDQSTWLVVHADQEYFLSIKLQKSTIGGRHKDDKAVTPRFPKPKLEGWFLVLGDRENRELVALKRLNTLKRETTETLSFFTPQRVGRMILTLWLVSDSYLGLDQLRDVRLDVIASDIASQSNQEVK